MNILTDTITIVLVILAHVSARRDSKYGILFEKAFSLIALLFIIYTSWRYVMILLQIFGLDDMESFLGNALAFIGVLVATFLAIFCVLPKPRHTNDQK
jgi:hypothetical protein